MKAAIYTLGCKVNQYESNVIVEQLKKNNYEIVDFEEKSDIYIINTCTVTNMSDRKSRQMIHKAKKQNVNAIVIVVGCLAQVAKAELEKIPGISLVLGNEEKKNIIKYINEYIEKNDQEQFVCVSDIMEQEHYVKEELHSLFNRKRAIIKIQDGCNNYCAYCIIPYARGKIRSKKLEDVLEEANNIAENGYKEIVLTGIHICSYGKDLENISLINLLEKLNEIDGIERIRLSSLEPNSITQEFLDRLVKLEKVCSHFHLSFQSCSNNVLKNMNRKYAKEELIALVNMIRVKYPDANITTDIIVGFPGETDEEFIETRDVLKQLKIAKIHVFQYSKREGTVAAKMKNQIDGNIKKARSEELLKISDENEKEFLKSFIGKKVEILVEERYDNFVEGFTTNYIRAKFEGDYKYNEIVKVDVIDVEGLKLVCKIV